MSETVKKSIDKNQNFDDFSEMKNKLDIIQQSLKEKDITQKKIDSINDELEKVKKVIEEFWKTNIEYFSDKAKLEQMETIKSKITQIEVELLKFNKELIALQGSIPNQIQTSPKTKKEFDDFLANDNEMSPAAKQARIAAAKNLLNQNIPGMDRVLS